MVVGLSDEIGARVSHLEEELEHIMTQGLQDGELRKSAILKSYICTLEANMKERFSACGARVGGLIDNIEGFGSPLKAHFLAILKDTTLFKNVLHTEEL
ncbi:hypothetical protein AMTR_s00065p00147530 [Amborella trichopoda]|uniref:Uncharacterized protein n=1 Tax=Amborella trichopoda TaxID=13333 RepID=U5D812_AMBTC|nr:hypothetical protein AMTR_s00065p00147530 [Amborella trichopoda]